MTAAAQSVKGGLGNVTECSAAAALVDPRVDSFFAAVERSIEDAFASQQPHEAPTTAVRPRPPPRPPVLAARPQVRYLQQRHHSSPSLPTRTIARTAGREVGTRDPLHPLHARQPGGREPTTGGAALGELLNSAVRPPSPELPKTPSLLSSREGQSQLRTAIRSNLQRVMDLFRELDEDGDGEIDRNEFRKGMQVSE